MRTMTESEISKWRYQERKKRKAAKQRENRAKKKARMELIKAAMRDADVLRASTGVVPDVETSSTDTGIVPDVQNRTGKAIQFPDVQNSPGKAIQRFSGVQTHMEKVSERKVPPLPEVKVPDIHMDAVGFDDFDFEIGDYPVDPNAILEMNVSELEFFSDISWKGADNSDYDTQSRDVFLLNDIGLDDARAIDGICLNELIYGPREEYEE